MILPVQFNTDTYKNSELYKYKHQSEQQTNDYLTYKKGQEELRRSNEEIQANKKTEAELEDLNPFEKSMNSFKEMGNDFLTGLDNRNENKINSMYDFGNYLTLGAFDGAKASYQGMENRVNVAMNSPYDFVNYLSNGTLDLGNGAINPEESFSKEHWYSSLGMASILTGGAGTVVGGVTKPKPSMSKLDNGGKGSLQGVADNIKIKDGKKNEIIEGFKVETREFVSDVVSGGTIFANGVRDGVNRLLNSNYYDNLGLSMNGPSNPWNVYNPQVVQDKIDGVLSKFSLRGNGGRVNNVSEEKFTKEQLSTKPSYSPVPEKWMKKGRTLKIEEDGTWVYTNKKGQIVRYPEGSRFHSI